MADLDEVAITEEFGLGGEPEPKANPNPEVLGDEPTEQHEEDDGMSDVERDARAQGWTPKEEFKGNPDNWKPAKQYVEWGVLQDNIKNLSGQVKGMKKSHNEEISNMNKYWEAALKEKESSLKAAMKVAVEDGDHDAVDNITAAQLENRDAQNALKKQHDPDAKSDTVLKAEWEIENDWISDPTDKRAGVANSAYTLAKAQGKSMAEILEFVNEKIQEKFPNGNKPGNRVNPNRNNPSDFSSGGRNGGGDARVTKITMKDCTQDELNMREVFETDEAFLKTVTNIRKGVK